MKIQTPEGILNLNDDARPSHDDQTDILSALTADGAEFEAACNAAIGFRDDTVANFYADAFAWVHRRRAALGAAAGVPSA